MKGVESEMIAIILVIVALALFVLFYLMFSAQGKAYVGNLSSNLSLGWPWK